MTCGRASCLIEVMTTVIRQQRGLGVTCATVKAAATRELSSLAYKTYITAPVQRFANDATAHRKDCCKQLQPGSYSCCVLSQKTIQSESEESTRPPTHPPTWACSNALTPTACHRLELVLAQTYHNRVTQQPHSRRPNNRKPMPDFLTATKPLR